MSGERRQAVKNVSNRTGAISMYRRLAPAPLPDVLTTVKCTTKDELLPR